MVDDLIGADVSAKFVFSIINQYNWKSWKYNFLYIRWGLPFKERGKRLSRSDRWVRCIHNNSVGWEVPRG